MTNPKPRKGVGAWFADVMMGFRFAVAGGRSGWIRAGLTALGVSLAVAMLLVAASVPTIVEADRERAQRLLPQTEFEEGKQPEGDVLLMDFANSKFQTHRIQGVRVQPQGPDAPVPPGIDALPKPGEMYVSPALAELLESEDGDLLRPRMDYDIVGTIADEGLNGPGTMKFYAGSDEIDPKFAEAASGFGVKWGPDPLSAILLMLVLVAVTIMLLPVVMFMAVAVRFGGEQRDRRLAALRLVGADRAMARRVAAGESLLGALAGLALGWALFEVGTRLLIGAGAIEYVTSGSLSIFVSDVVPDPLYGLIVVLAVPVVSVFATQLSMRRLVVEPLGVVRDAKPIRRRLWWRLVLAGLGVAALASTAFELLGNVGDLKMALTVFGVLTLLLGVAAVLPWVVETLVNRLRGGAPSWQLATRRLQLGGGSAFRAVIGVAVAAAGAIALQMLFNAVQSSEVSYTGADPDITTMSSYDGPVDAEAVTAEVNDIDGATVEQSYATLYALLGEDDDAMLVIMDCEWLTRTGGVGECADGDVFTAKDTPPVKAGGELTFWQESDGESGEHAWTVPSTDGEAELTVSDADEYMTGLPTLIATPGALDAEVRALAAHIIEVRTDPAKPDAVEQVRNIAATQVPSLHANTNNTEEMSQTFAKLRDVLLLGVVATMLLIGLSLLVNTIEQLQERRRVVSVLVAFGARRRSLILSVLWQTAIPVMLALLVATGAGVGLGHLLVSVTVYEPVVDWPSLATFNGVGAAMVLLVTLLSLPALWRMMRPDGIRTE